MDRPLEAMDGNDLIDFINLAHDRWNSGMKIDLCKFENYVRELALREE